MKSIEIIHTMTFEQAQKIAKVIHNIKDKNMVGAKKIMLDMSIKELDLLVAYIEALRSEEGVCQ